VNVIPINSLRLIGIHGHAGVGKDTISAYLHSNYQKVYGESFADPLKDACAEAFGIDREYFEDPDLKSVVHEYWGVTPRMMAQFVGTELFRNHIGLLLASGNNIKVWELESGGKNFWITRLAARLSGALNEYKTSPYTPGDCVVIADVRFQNEYDFIIANDGIVIHLTRPGFSGNVGISGHSSEAGIANFHTPEATFHVTNSGTLNQLYEQVDAIIGDRLMRKSDGFPL